MALSDSALKAEIISQMQAQGFDPTNPATGGEAEKYIEAIATAVVNHITSAAEVPVAGGGSYGGGIFPVT